MGAQCLYVVRLLMLPDVDVLFQYCATTPRDLPNMGQKERGASDESRSQPALTPSPSQASASPSTPRTTLNSLPGHIPMTPSPSASNPAITASSSSNEANADAKGVVSTGWGLSLRQVIWEKWRWGVVLALAVIVSRLSSSS